MAIICRVCKGTVKTDSSSAEMVLEVHAHCLLDHAYNMGTEEYDMGQEELNANNLLKAIWAVDLRK